MKDRILRATLLILIALFLLSTMSCNRQSGSTPEKENTETIEWIEFNSPGFDIFIYEGSGEFSEFKRIDSRIVSTSFECPEPWGVLIMSNTFSEGERFEDDFVAGSKAAFIEVFMDRMSDMYKPNEEALYQEGVKSVQEIELLGIKGFDQYHGIDPTTGEYLRNVYLMNDEILIKIKFKSSSGRSEAEYNEIADRFLETLSIDYRKWLMNINDSLDSLRNY